MTNRFTRSFPVLAKAALAAALFGAIFAQPGWASPAARVAGKANVGGGSNLSGNPYFPLVAGAKWTYKYSTSSSTFTTTESVTGSSVTAAGTNVTLSSSSSLLPGKATTLTYTIGTNGSVKVESGTGTGSSAASFSLSYWIPTASQIQSCAACKFSGPFSASFSGQSMTGTLAETATALGAKTVRVPAGKFSTYELQLTVAIKTTGTLAMSMKMTFHLYLAKNVGMVENSGGTMGMTYLGHALSEPLGSDELLSYTA
ncbi:MAG TPA: hypothetical protein VME20_12230 [Acidimicrobiales bacterium]|nr:hypothetical protein [Acidimicrobiales bacterium]